MFEKRCFIFIILQSKNDFNFMLTYFTRFNHVYVNVLIDRLIKNTYYRRKRSLENRTCC